MKRMEIAAKTAAATRRAAALIDVARIAKRSPIATSSHFHLRRVRALCPYVKN
jgi:hypothetical protein